MTAEQPSRRRRFRHAVGPGRGRAGERRRRARHRARRVRPRVDRAEAAVRPRHRGAAAADWALQDPADWRAALGTAVRAALRDSGADPAAVVGIGTDFTACTVLPVLRDGTPLCEVPELRGRPHAWPKLWKHHAAQPQADRITELAHARGETVDRPLRRPDLVGVAVRQGAAAAGGGPGHLPADGALDRGRRLDRLAAVRHRDAQRLHRRRTRGSTRTAATRRRTTSRRSTRSSATSRRPGWPACRCPRSAAGRAR